MHNQHEEETGNTTLPGTRDFLDSWWLCSLQINPYLTAINNSFTASTSKFFFYVELGQKFYVVYLEVLYHLYFIQEIKSVDCPQNFCSKLWHIYQKFQKWP